MQAAGVGLLYFAGAHLALRLTAAEQLALVWPPAGILLAALALQPRSSWPLTLFAAAGAAVLANLLAANSLAVSLAFAAANLLESLLAALVLAWALGGPPDLRRLRDLLWLAGGVALLSNALSACFGAAVPTLAFGAAYWEAWRIWWLADGLGMLLVGGAAFAWAAPGRRGEGLTQLRLLELGALAAVGAAVSAFVIFSPPVLPVFQSPYLLFPLLFWAAARFGPRGATSGSLLLAAALIAATGEGRGPFALPSLSVSEGVLDLQLFLAVLTFSALCLAALVAERAAAQAVVADTLAQREEQIAARTADLVLANQKLAQEVEERRQVEAALRASQARVRLLMDGILDYAISMLDPAGRVVSWNAGAERIKGYSADEILGRHISCFYPPNLAAGGAPEQELAVAAERGRYTGEGWRLRRDGSRFWANVSITSLYDDAGALLGFAEVTHDDTARRESEQAIRFQAQLLDSVQQAVIATDLAGRIIYWNRFAEALYGWRPAEVLGRLIVEVTPAETSAEQAQALMATLLAGMSWSGEFPVRRRDGTVFPALVTDSPMVDAAGRLIGIVGVSMDITDRKAAEQALREAHAALELRVAARTRELAVANARLQEELAERIRAETALAGQLRAQQALARSAQLLLQPAERGSRRGIFDQALEALRQGIGCSQVFLFGPGEGQQGGQWGTLIARAADPGGVEGDGPLAVERFPWPPLAPPVATALAEGWPVAGSIAELFSASPALADLLQGSGLQSALICPVQAGRAWGGLLGFAQQGPRSWADYEHLLLRTATDLLHHVLQRWEAEDALADSERRFRAIFDSQFQFIGLLDPTGTLLEANNTALRFGGFTLADVVGRPFWEARWWAAMGPETQRRLQIAIAAAAAGAFVRYEVDVCGAGERIETIDFSLKPLRDANGAVVLLIPEGRLISEQKRAALALRRSEQRYRSLVAAAPVGIFESDAEGAYTFVNEGWCAIAGITPAQAMGSGWAAALHPDDRAVAFAHWQAFAAGRGDYHRDLRYRHADGRVRWTSADAVQLRDDDGSVIGYLGTVTDITERKQAELELSASLAEKEVLLREIHHRVKNNLQVVSSLLRLQRRRVSDPQVIAALGESEQRVAVMVLVHQLLYQGDSVASLDAQAYFEQLSSQVQQLYSVEQRRVAVRVTGDGQHLNLEQAVPCGLLVHELLTNSFKYAFPEQGNGTITIDLRRVSPASLQLRVADSGVGLPDPAPAGTSLGMRLIEGFVRQLQGRLIWSTGAGATATIQFPSSATAMQPLPAAPERTEP